MANYKSLAELGHIIQSLATSLDESLKDARLPQPLLSPQGASSQILAYPDAAQAQRAELLDALDELRALVLGPTSYLFYTSILSPSWIGVFDVLYRCRIAYHVPAEGAISYADLSALCGLEESDTRRIVRAAISLRIFEEEPVEFVRHNAISAVLKTPLAHDAVGFFTEEFTPAALKLAESLQRFPASGKAGESAIAIANGSVGDKDIFSLISHDADRVKRFANAQSFNTTVLETSSSHLVNNMPWSPTCHPGHRECATLVVDVGGSRGDVCEALLSKYPGIKKAIVQDLPEVTEKNLERQVSGPLTGRIEYQAYDFFTEQPVKNADVYIFRTVLHDWPDSYAVRILQNQIPALKPGARILINDICIHYTEGETSSIIKQAQCSHDIFVKMGLNAKERTREDWTALLSAADERFEIKSIVTPPQSVHSILEVVWRGDLVKEGPGPLP
ncbi:S-adenosyl-L-methionine-dependent methyltransferase [Durotheca rogersii]|uniref:S-adenosyl-L-methionine-dependent methyltransferase n=1 Tax=Durotheca rogersii TaxID=419775 RepID=UPI00221F3F93|nr:S-adenosyl-L-methionine-dependent methyltransferase [Durotheca rogersii]KAI5862348.1 S-adenosyl-L-methionine-dependent methyltransferase [Durotheca rogersii]